VWRDASRHSAMINQSGNPCLPLNIWQRTVKKYTKNFYPRDFFRGVQAAGSMKLNVFWKTLSGLILIKEAVISNIDWRIFLVISIFPDIL
jgi:hypothetical protein